MPAKKDEALIRILERGETITLGHVDSGPSESVALGHIGAKEFNRRYKAEGWNGDAIRENEILHEYRRVTKKKIKRSCRSDDRALAVSVVKW